MEIIKREGVWCLFDKTVPLILTDEKQLEIILKDPAQPLFAEEERGYSGERRGLYDPETSLIDILKRGQEQGAQRLEVSYDFFFGGKKRTNYPDSEITVAAFKVIHDLAEKHGLDFSASIISPLDIGGGYAQKHEPTGSTYQYQEGLIDEEGNYSVDMVYQKQWCNNKGPIELKLDKVLVYAFREERLGNTSFFYVNPDEIVDISSTAHCQVDEASVTITGAGYGYGKMRMFGRWEDPERIPGFNRCLAVAVYKTPELDYFSPQALPYMKSVIDLHKDAGIDYQGFYSDEMHIQFDWDLSIHFGHEEINTRYLTDSLMGEYADRYGEQYRNFARYLIYFSYHQHDFLGGEEGSLPAQHVFGKDEKSIYQTWLFRKRYFELLQRRVVDLCNAAKDYAEELFGGPIMTRAHATWQESPTCDRFYDRSIFTEHEGGRPSRYEYTPSYVWSSSIRENISACYDYFLWNDFLTGAGTDHPEGGNIDRNYYAQALACSFGVLNKFPYAYCGSWGSPKEVLQRLQNIGISYGTTDWRVELGHSLVQGLSHRLTDVLALYPLELNYVEERFGSWMVQYGYCNYITEGKLLENATVTGRGTLLVKGREYRALVVLFEPFVRRETLELIRDFLSRGGKVVWTSIYPLLAEDGEDILPAWKELFGIRDVESAIRGTAMPGETIAFRGLLADVRPMQVLTDMLPDRVYPCVPGEKATVVAVARDKVLGAAREHAGGGLALYLGFRPRDDQSCSTGQDIDTLFSVLKSVGAYDPDGLEVRSRPAGSRYNMNRFPNGAVSIANHYRTFYEKWSGRFFRDEKEDAAALEGRELPPVEINLREMLILGHTITYTGMDVLTYNLGPAGRLLGFAGSNTKGITVDGKKYEFVQEPADLVWTVIPEEQLAAGIKSLFLARVDRPTRLTLPLSGLPNASRETAPSLQVRVCDDSLFTAGRAVPYEWDGENLAVNISEEEAGKWIAVILV